MPAEPIDFGASAVILPLADGALVRKKMRRNAAGHDELTQQRIHRTSQTILQDRNNFDYLRMPVLEEGNWIPLEHYVMQRVDVTRPLFLGDRDSCASILNDRLLPEHLNLDDISNELARWWRQMWTAGFAPWDFELYVQRNGRVILLDVDKFGFRREGYGGGGAAAAAGGGPAPAEGPPVQMPVPLALDTFFHHPCFPTDFLDRILSFGPLEGLGSLQNQLRHPEVVLH